MTDVVVVGGGVIGLSIAWELAGQGRSVVVLEQGTFGGEASWAGAGMLPPGHLPGARTPEARLRAASFELWPNLAAELYELTGIDNGYRRCGGIEIRTSAGSHDLSREIAEWREEGVTVEEPPSSGPCWWESSISPRVSGGYRLPDLAQIRNPRHVKSLLAGCAARGVQLLAGQGVVHFDRQGDRVLAARTPHDVYAADWFCIAGGAWSRMLLAGLGADIPIEPVRGQIVLLSALPLPFHHVLQVGRRYLVPRPDGRLLVGSTEEHAGFDKRNTADAIRDLLDFATDLVPALADARFERAWSGLRPGSPDDLPYLGRIPTCENVFVAAGHFRSGLQMSPVTGRVMRQLLLDQPTMIPLEGLEPSRHSQSPSSAETSVSAEF